MPEKTLIARVLPDGADPDALLVRSPVVGLADGAPRVGTYLNPLDRILTFRILNQSYTLRLPRDVQGRVTEVCVPEALCPVAFGDCLLKISTRALAGDAAAVAATGSGRNAAAGDGLGPEGITIAAPSVGIFYRRPSPDAEPYVDVGSAVASGTVLGLVEVMKCFNQITYGGPEFPDRGTVTKILAEDGAEVQFGQPLFRIRAAG
jgi:biotin carboxyl carrier protein